MRLGILSDIHANFEALEAVLSALAKEQIDRFLCPGDIVGYGADPVACIAEIKKLNPLIVAGNHDWASVGLLDSAYFNPYARRAVIWTGQNLSYAEQEYLKSLALIYQDDALTLVHGSLEHPEEFGYILVLPSAINTFNLCRTRLCFIGHSHAPVTFIKEGENFTCTFQEKLKITAGKMYIINAGSVGQPRDGNPQAAYAVYDSEKEEVQIKRVAYDIQQAQDKIIQAGLPRILAERLALGR